MTIIDPEKLESLKKECELKFELCSYLSNSENSYETDRIMVPKHMNDDILQDIFEKITLDDIVLAQTVELTQLSQRLVIFEEQKKDDEKKEEN